MKTQRNRIVINLDQNKPRAARQNGSRGGFGRVLLLIGIILVVVVGGLAAGGYFWWRNYQSGPAYALAVFADAAQRNDVETVDSMLDYDAILKTFVAQTRPGPALGDLPLPNLGQIEALSPSVSAKVKQTLQNEVHAEAKRISERAAGKPFLVIALAIGWVVDIKQQENVAQANLNIQNEKIQLTMQRDGERWRIVGVQDDNLTKVLTNAAVRNLPR